MSANLFFSQGLFLVQPVAHIIYENASVSPALSATFNNLLAAAYFTTFTTSLIATTLIAYRLYVFSNETDWSRRRFKHIADIVVQSGAVYSLTALATAIGGVLPGGSDLSNTQTINFQNYIEAIGVYVAVRALFMYSSCFIKLIIQTGNVGNYHGRSCWPSPVC